nr:hypothetical protein [Solirubrobacterales bacterium]
MAPVAPGKSIRVAGNEHSGETGGALDVLLTDAAVGPARRWLPGRAGIEVAARLAVRPDKVVR